MNAADILLQFQGNPWLQGSVAAISTFVLEDPVTVTCGLLVADGRMNAAAAWIGLCTGITVGDIGLYALGRYLASSRFVKRRVSEAKMAEARGWANRNLVRAVLASRFIPGARLPTYLAAGAVKASFSRFALVAAVASSAWTTLLLWLTAQVGGAALPLLGETRWLFAGGLIALMVLWNLVRIGRRNAGHLDKVEHPAEPVVSRFEFWHPVVFYLPVAVYYVWLSLKHGGVATPTCANPRIYSGGICRESKHQILSLVSGTESRSVLPSVLFHKTPGQSAADELEAALQLLAESGLHFPIVAKPDEGQRGAGVRKIAGMEELQDYLREFPSGVGILFQRLARFTEEAGVFYCRRPGEAAGTIISLTLKSLPSVTGDGRLTLRELILADARARHVAPVYFRRFAASLDMVPGRGETYPLVFAGNHCQGAIFRDGTHLVTPDLIKRMDSIAQSIQDFYFGRFDLKYASLESLAKGEDIEIIEINGAAAECTHIWDARMGLREAYNVLFGQFRLLFEIGAANRRQGARPLSGMQILRDFLQYHKTARQYPSTS